MTLTVVTPAAPLLTYRDAVLRQWMRLDDYETEENALIDALAAEAVSQVERYTRRYLLTQTLRLTLDRFCGPVRLPAGPVQSVTSVTYLDGTGTEQTLDAAAYRLVTSAPWPEVVPIYGTTWPHTRFDRDAVWVDFVAGYGDTAADVDAQLIGAVRHLVLHKFRHRSEPDKAGAFPARVMSMLAPYRDWV